MDFFIDFHHLEQMVEIRNDTERSVPRTFFLILKTPKINENKY